MWPTAEQRAASKKAGTKTTTTKKAAPKKTVTKKSTPKKVVKLPKEPKSTKSASTKSTILPLKPSSKTYRGQATLGTKRVRSSPTFQRVMVDGQSYVLVPENEHTPPPVVDSAKVDALVMKLREVKNELLEEEEGEEAGTRRNIFSLAGRHVEISIAMLMEGMEVVCGGGFGKDVLDSSGCIYGGDHSLMEEVPEEELGYGYGDY